MRELRKLKQEDLIFFDIETAPLVKELEVGSPLYDSWAYKVNKDGEATEQHIVESYSKEAGLYPEFAKVVSIVVGKIVDNKIVLGTLDYPEERAILEAFNSMIERNVKSKLAGFVNIGFDSPFVFKRMLINGIRPHDKLDSSGLKPWELEEIDLGILWKGTSFNRASLINIATAFGLPSPKDDISGADVGRVYWDEGAEGLKRISKYCRKDVVTTINIFKKMRLEAPLVAASEDEPTDALPEVVQGELDRLFSGGGYTKEDKAKLVVMLKKLPAEDREKAYTVLDSMTSAAKGKKTKITKTHVKALKEEVSNE
jgi:uncharacterized protein YprB with RNaseH-like and TPR domain